MMRRGGVLLLPIDIIAVMHLEVPVQQIQCVAERGVESVIVVVINWATPSARVLQRRPGGEQAEKGGRSELQRRGKGKLTRGGET
jgi:hypothetical protein